jgi:hypothetical protein
MSNNITINLGPYSLSKKQLDTFLVDQSPEWLIDAREGSRAVLQETLENLEDGFFKEGNYAPSLIQIKRVIWACDRALKNKKSGK